MDNLINFLSIIANEHPIATSDQEKIENVNKFIFEDLIPLIDSSNIYEDEHLVFEKIKKNYSYWVNITKKPWLKNKCVIAFMGKFSAGKSSIINSLLDQKLLPVDVTPSTAVPTYISYGSSLSFKVLDNDEDIKNIDFEVYKVLTKNELKNFPLSSFIRYIVLEYNNKNLLNKSILDTPGISSIDYKDTRKAIEVIQESDAIFWVIDINDGGITQDVQTFFLNYIINKPLYFILNKADTKPPKEQEAVLSKIEKTLIQNNISFKKLILYSAKDIKYTKSLKKLIDKIIKQNKNEFYSEINYILNESLKKINNEIILLKETKFKLEIRNERLEKTINMERQSFINHFNKLVNFINKNFRERLFFEGAIIDNSQKFYKLINKFSDYLENFTSDKFLKNYEEIGKNKLNILEKSDSLKKSERLRNNIEKLKNKFKEIMEDN